MRHSDQLELASSAKAGWGRSRSGRRPGPKARIPHRSRPALDGHHPCHITLRVRRGIPSLRSRCLVEELERSFRASRERGDFRLVQYSIQRDHVHLLVESDDAHALGRGMMAIGSRIARAANRVFGRTGRVLDDHYHLHVLRTPREVRNAIAYVLNNARKHAVATGRALASLRGRVDVASSSRWFAGWQEKLPAAHDPPAVATAQTWLMRIGWLRHGLVSIDEVPATARA